MIAKMRCLAVILTTSSLICNSVVVVHTAPTAHPALLTQMDVKQWNYLGKWDTLYGCNSKDQYICSVSFVAMDMAISITNLQVCHMFAKMATKQPQN